MNDETTTTTPIFTLDFGEDGSVQLYEPQEVVDWVDKELAAWKWLEDQARGNGTVQPSVSAYTALNAEMSRHLQNLRTQINNPNVINTVKTIESSFTNLYKQGRFIPSFGSKGHFICELKETNPKSAAFAFGYLTNTQGIRPDPVESTKGNLAAWAYEQGFQGTVEPERRALQDLKKKWDDEYEKTKQLNIEIEETISHGKESLSQLTSEYQKIILNSKEELNQFKHEYKAKLDQALDESKSKLSEIEKTYDEKLALQAPVTYWRDKEKSHKENAFKSIVIAGIGGGISLAAIIGLAKILMGKDLHPPYFDIVTLLAVAVACFWVLRLLVRNYLIQSHLQNDAAERIFMTNTYLSLQRSEHEMSEDDRHLILTALFRSASSAPGSDETSPPMVAELARLLSKR